MRRTEPLAPMPDDPAAALEPYDPARGHGPWDARTAAHLLRRALGGASAEQIAAAVQDGPQATLERLFAPPDPEQAAQWEALGAPLRSGGRRELASWWLCKLAQDTRAPGTRLTLFWHDHFACALSKVADLSLLYQQHQTFVQLGEGPFGALLLAMARDPALLRYLDGDENRRGIPNENLARELFELFTLGVGHYSENDVREAARALTGRTLRQGRYHYAAEYHDGGRKEVLGRAVEDGDALCAAALEQPACPRFLVRKLWCFYLSPEPPEPVVELLAERRRAQHMDTAWLVRTLLGARACYSAPAYRALVKSPVDYVLGVVRTLGSRPDFLQLADACERMGQALFEPPGVQGWKEGEAWIHTAAWLERTRFAASAAGGEGSLLRGTSLARAGRGLAEMLDVWLQADLPAARRQDLDARLQGLQDHPPALVQAVLCLPEYHLA